jgi:hypothetical protein
MLLHSVLKNGVIIIWVMVLSIPISCTVTFVVNRRKIHLVSLHAVVENRYLCKLLRSVSKNND